MITFEAPTRIELTADIRRTQQVLAKLFGDTVFAARRNRFECAMDDLMKEGRRVLEEIEAHPKHNEHAERTDRIIRVIEIAAELARLMADEYQVHPNSLLLRPLQRNRAIDRAVDEVYGRSVPRFEQEGP